ncbi:hypothetical protein J5N97_013082 [Dioscorea zingiberensis]|uniref:SAC3/GANP/THP3 conserved domain-containing protein n=1 Tax=Dioscorea zingiberensis TaxID=325984 RepID=A0A9D5CQK5_9LILI|nr:hypothetical protein J5N97_013082 [Dioscorea zingiberensis]
MLKEGKSPSIEYRSLLLSRDSDSYDGGALPPLKAAHLNAPKRARSPSIAIYCCAGPEASAQVDYDGEMQAKAKRLVRFNAELSQPLRKLQDLIKQKPLGKKQTGTMMDTRSVNDHPAGTPQVLTSGDILSDYGGSKSSDAVIGLCQDMCPESEREERERKGDLDKYERLNGERNQTNKFLAVKKYNRTAERDADLIRPMPVLQKTIDYLLDILGQPYSDNFLGIYNFLWDRMRAIRMDLRMQHIFNQDAITMLEQMVEPAELSLDLAKMAPEVRCSPEIMFARNVARACRMGNYITFFRLAKKATYLQACLMHAHFAKIRTQALASLHSGLQNNQGIPIQHIVKWLGMEGEDIEALLEYHGFALRKYEEMYMVKVGPFCNSDTDFPIKCAKLVFGPEAVRKGDG